MSDRLRPLALGKLTSWIADEIDAKGSIFGIPLELGFFPRSNDPFRSEVFGQLLETPLGVAAGPHSQLAQNIIVAWLSGARFIELKTVQTLDQLEIAKPCIDMQDVGYNVEWSQELRVEESFREYLHAWVLIHCLHRFLDFPGPTPGVIFNLSVGYNLEGIRQPNMQRFLDQMENAGDDLDRCIQTVSKRFPVVHDVAVPSRLSDNVTLSTMHGCPPEEIGSISKYLLCERRLHTAVKLNPTLLGPAGSREILNDRLGFEDIEIPDEAFAHDLAFDDAVELVGELRTTAARADRRFGVKLTNTLEVRNHRSVFSGGEKTMYLSGRPLHALTVNLAHLLSGSVEPGLLMSFSGGADASNTAALLQCGLRTVTVCSDLLRPGGYLRLGQYLENVRAAVSSSDSSSLEDFVRSGSPGSETLEDASTRNLSLYADSVLSDAAYHAETFHRDHTKTTRRLELFDCIRAPCTDICDVDQQVPEYMRRVRNGDLDGAASVTRFDNPLASILGRTCHHPCEPVCLRTHMDQPLAIREIKRFITDHEKPPEYDRPGGPNGPAVAVVGGGPCGLAAATFLSRAGRKVTVFEARPSGGGMVSATIPGYRAAHHAVERDLDRVRRLGVEFRYGQEVGTSVTLDSLRREGFGAIVIAVGARRGRPLGLEGEDAEGVFDGLDFLRAVRREEAPELGPRIGVVGGGDVAMDCARSARRLSEGEVTVFYRRTRREMPAQDEELHDLLAEGGRIEELASPARILESGGRLDGVEMAKMRLGDPDPSGRRRPEVREGAEFEVGLDTLIIAIGQRPDLSVFAGEEVALNRAGYLEVDPVTLETSLPGVYAGGDIIGGGPASIVKAAGDGRRIAEAILAGEGEWTDTNLHRGGGWPDFDRLDLVRRRARTEARTEIPNLPSSDRRGFDEVVLTLSTDDAIREAARCLDCDLMCSTCETVCPNRAIFTYTAVPNQLGLPTFEQREGRVVQAEAVGFRVAQGPQVAVLADACNECGNCVTFCPTSGRPWRDKPRFFLHRDDFEAEDDNAFMLLRYRGLKALQARFSGTLHELLVSDRFHYSSSRIAFEMDLRSLEATGACATHPEDSFEDFDPTPLGSMISLIRALSASLPELPAVEADPQWILGAKKSI